MDTFELEQDILRAWYITDDIKYILNSNRSDKEKLDAVKTIHDFYNIKFEKLWETFEA